jgi:hypothetical protein
MFVFKPKIPIWVHVGGPWNRNCFLYFMIIWNIVGPFGVNLWQVGIVCGHLLYFFPFWYV